MFERVRQLLIKEFIQVFRDPRMRGVLFFMPVFQMVIFGYAVTTDVRDVPTAVYDLDHSQSSRDLVAAFVRSGYFEVVENISDDRRAQDLIDHGQVSAILRLNKGFEEDLKSGRQAHVQIIIDGTDSNTASIVLSYSVRIAEEFSEEVLVERLGRLQGLPSRLGQVDLRTRAWFNENLESRNFFVPGIIAALVSLVTLLLTSMAVVREREIGTMEQLMVTPITPLEFILGKTLPFAILSLANVVLVLVVGRFWFDVPIRGSLAILFLATLFYLITMLGVGLFISTICRTQQQAMMSTFFYYFPSFLLSGFVFPIANMPPVVQWLTLFNPLRYFLVIIRGIFLKGVGLEILWPQIAVLAAMGVVTLGLASSRIRKTLA
jgi:ABC-2 type transport system permease protein